MCSTLQLPPLRTAQCQVNAAPDFVPTRLVTVPYQFAFRRCLSAVLRAELTRVTFPARCPVQFAFTGRVV